MIASISKPKKRRPLMAEINITPFTDVVLVILIIFMVSASYVSAQKALNVNLPAAKAAENLKDKQNLDVTITSEGKVYLNGDIMSIADMPAELRARNKAKPVDMVIVRADKVVPYDRVVRVMDAVKLAGIENIAFPTQPEGGAKR